MNLCQVQVLDEDKSEDFAESCLYGNMILSPCLRKGNCIEVEEDKPSPNNVRFYDCLVKDHSLLVMKMISMNIEKGDHYPNMPCSRVALY